MVVSGFDFTQSPQKG